MPRWRQDPKTHKLIPIDDAARIRDGVAIHGPIEPFVSPLDGKTVISGRKQLRDHMKQHNVVPADEFPPEYYERKAKERAKHFLGEHTAAERQARGEEIHRAILRAEGRIC